MGHGWARWTLWPLALLSGVVVMAGGAQGFGGYSLDLYEYQCYAAAFWHGAAGVGSLPATQCFVMQSISGFQVATQPFHTLPREYGALALAVFSPPLLAPAEWYPWLFTGEMVLALLATAFLCARWGPRLAGHAYLLYVLLGNAIIAGTRFDAVPALLTLLAVVWARRGWRGQAYAALAAATLLKVYPLVFLVPFLVADMRADLSPHRGQVVEGTRGTGNAEVTEDARSDTEKENRALFVPSVSFVSFVSSVVSALGGARWWGALRGLAVYGGVLALGIGLALLLNPTGALGPLTFLAGRGVEFESVPATLLLLAHRGAGDPFSIGYEANVTVVASPLAGAASAASLALGLGLAGAGVWLQWRGRLTLGRACLVVLLGALVASKVFSPQYLLWLAPLVALEYGLDAVWSVVWGAVCLLTALAFPVAYADNLAWTGIPSWQAVMWLSGLRNAALVFTGALILWRAGVTDMKPQRTRRTRRLRGKMRSSSVSSVTSAVNSSSGLPSLGEAP